MHFIFITGGVSSSLGKGLATAALASLLQFHGFKVRLRKLDPYLNVDPGTMSPYQHGEVFVTDDGAETDLDLGHYERFTNVDSKKTDSISTVTYLRVPERRWDGDGAFYFVYKKQDELKSYHINPEPGLFIIMPTNLLHGAYPQGPGTRQTLNLDFKIKIYDNI